jgi:triosephosphate isomerase (TIM)
VKGPRPLVAGNWKMNGGLAMLKEPRLLAAMLKDVKLKADVMVCPPAMILRRVKSVLKGTKIKVGGQDCHWNPSGAHTGDISAEMLKDAGCSAVIVGHSERRTNHGETDEMVRSQGQGRPARRPHRHHLHRRDAGPSGKAARRSMSCPASSRARAGRLDGGQTP